MGNVINSDTSSPLVIDLNGYYYGQPLNLQLRNTTFGIVELTSHQLAININPLEGGNVTGDGISCNVDTSSICQYQLNQGTQVALTANANCGWAFGFWDNGSTITDNPYTFNMPSGNQTLYAKFFKTFRNTTIEPRFNQYSGTGGECVPYVRYETEILYEACNGPAYQCFSQAQAMGYSTGSIPREGAIIVFAQDSSKQMPNGHVDIIKNRNEDGTYKIHDSNWCQNDCQQVSEHNVDITDYNILGYIYFTP